MIQARSGLVVPDEEDAAVVARRAGRRFAEVVDERAEAKRPAAREPVGERLGEQLGHGGGVLARVGVEVPLDLDDPAQNLERVPVGIKVVVRVLGHAAQGVELGQHRRHRPELGEHFDAADRIGPAEHRRELGELALAGRLARPDPPPRGRSPRCPRSSSIASAAAKRAAA